MLEFEFSRHIITGEYFDLTFGKGISAIKNRKDET